MSERKQFYVKVIMAGNRVDGYGVYDDAGGTETEHQWFFQPDYEPLVSLHLANCWRDVANSATGEA